MCTLTAQPCRPFFCSVQMGPSSPQATFARDWPVSFDERIAMVCGTTAADSIHDLLLIQDHLNQAYLGFGESVEEASHHAQARIEQIISSAEQFAVAPLRGESHDDHLPGLRHLALDRAVYWSRVRPEQHEIQVLDLFFRGQDHQRDMLVRLLQNSLESPGALL
jgi:toxin ParE1/3/4